jgi:cytidine deaminase
MLSENQIKNLIQKAKEAMDYSYSPYSHFKVGAALLTESGEIFTGCNVENSSFGATICAERVAVTSAVAKGHTKFNALAVISTAKELCTPCGICRQVISEFSLEIPVICCKGNGEYEIFVLGELLPKAFRF